MLYTVFMREEWKDTKKIQKQDNY